MGAKPSPKVEENPQLSMTALEALMHTVAACALFVFGLMSLCIGGNIMANIGLTAPVGVLLVSAGLIMWCIGLPERFREVKKIWERVNSAKKTESIGKSPGR